MEVQPGTDFQAQPEYLRALNITEAWRYSRGHNIKVAVIDSGVRPNPRLPRLVGGGDSMTADGDGLADCDGHGTLVASMIAGSPANPPTPDGFSGIAPDATVISIRGWSQAFAPAKPHNDWSAHARSTSIRTLARAVVHAADMGADVINISSVNCMSADDIIEQSDLGAALRYAAIDKNAVIISAAGDTSQPGCQQNSGAKRRSAHVDTVVSPAWFSDYVLTVGGVDAHSSASLPASVAGPWVSIAAPGTDVEGFSNSDDALINAVEGPGNQVLLPISSGFAAAAVAGVAALVRAKYPNMSSRQTIDQLVQTAKPPSGGPDNLVGNGIVDPVAALTRWMP